MWHEIFTSSRFPAAPAGLGPNSEKHRPGEEGVKDGVVGGADGAGTLCLIAEFVSRFSRQ